MRAVHLARAQDDALVVEATALLRDVVTTRPADELLDPSRSRAAFADAMWKLCSIGRSRRLPIEQILVALKQGWAAMPEVRSGLGEGQSEVLSAAVSECIEQYFAESEHRRRE
jgi:hypothetical protein